MDEEDETKNWQGNCFDRLWEQKKIEANFWLILLYDNTFLKPDRNTVTPTTLPPPKEAYICEYNVCILSKQALFFGIYIHLSVSLNCSSDDDDV